VTLLFFVLRTEGGEQGHESDLAFFVLRTEGAKVTLAAFCAL